MGKNKVMEAKNRKVRMYDMLASTWRKNTKVSLEYRFGDVTPPKSDNAFNRYEYNKFMWEHAEAVARYRSYLKAVGGC